MDYPSAPLEASDAGWWPVADRLRAALANEFDVDGELGHGGMAAVFRARELALNRHVAIKVMAPGLLHGDGMVERFRQEAITVANLQHANIIAVHGVRTIGDLHLFVMQYVPGRSLDRILRDQGALSVTSIRAVLYAVGSALDYAHRRGVIHRDIKPANILLDGDGDPIVTDFGIAKIAEAPGYTRVGTVIGTPAYMSPEHCMGHEVGPPSDQYALGIVAYEMLTGHPPFAGDGMALMRAHVDLVPPPLRDRRGDVPPELDSAVMRMLAKRPEHRFPDLASAIEAFGGHPLPSAGPLRAEMETLAAAAAAETRLASIVRSPRTPVPGDRAPTPPASSPNSAPRDARTGSATITALAIEPPLEPLEVGDCVVVEATARDANGASVESPRVRWSSSNPTVAEIDSAGVLTALRPGATRITAFVGDISTTLELGVTAPRVARIEIDAPTELRCGTRTTLVARPLDRRARPLTMPVMWTSRNTTVATVAADGTLTALRRGPAVLVATCADVTRAVSITITTAPVTDVVIDSAPTTMRVGSSIALRAVVRTGRGGTDDDRHVIEWRSSDPSIVTIAADGTLVARKPGHATVSAVCDGVCGEAPITVVTELARTIVIGGLAGPLRLGDDVTLGATVYDAGGNVIHRPVTWRSSDARVASIDNAGRLSARAEGWAIVTAAADGVESPVEIVVRPQVIPVSASGQRESRRLAVRWWLLLAALAGVIALGWRFLRR